MSSIDQQEILTYLNAIFGRCEDGQGEIILGDKDKYQHGIFLPSRLANLAQLIPFTPSCYIKHALINSEAMLARNKHGVGTEEEVSAINAIALDVDANKEGYATRSEVLEALYKMPKPPSMVVNSNGMDGGFHVYWILDKPYRVEGDRGFLKHISEVWHDELNSYVRIDSTYDLSRYLRPVGCKRESGNFVSIHEYHPDRRYSIDDLTIPGCNREPDIQGQGQGRLMVHNWLSRCNAKVYEQSQHRKGLQWFIECPKHYLHTTPNNKRDCRIVQDKDGRLGGSCFHSSCGLNSWAELRDAIGKTIKQDYRPAEETTDLIQPMSAKDMFDEHPTLRPVLIDGILRRGETANIIASPKVGKSFLAGNLAWAVASGGSWLSHDVVRGSVLIIDNELHPPTLAHRIERIRMSMMLKFEDCEQVDLISLRGKSVDIHGLGSRLDIQEGKYSLVVIDALYRMLPPETSENDNAAMMAIYNRLDEYAAKWDAAIAVVHHASKGMQGDKSVTDVGSGAGAISRAADTHIILRPHENEKLIVMEAATRSFKGIEPTSASFEYPLWHAVGGVTAVVKRQRGTDAQTKKEYEEDKSDILLRLASGKVQQKDIKNLYGGNDRFNRLIGSLIKENKVRRFEVVPEGKKKEEVWYELVPG